MAAGNVHIEMFFDKDSATFSYVVSDKDSGVAAIIDPVLNYDAAAGQVSTEDADKILAYLRENNLSAIWILETHAHADHLSAAHYLHSKTGAPVAIGEGIKKVQQTFKLVIWAMMSYWRRAIILTNYLPITKSLKLVLYKHRC